jgi:cell division protein FtsL
MVRLNLLLLAVLTACALGLVTSQHKARKLFVDLEEQQEHSRTLEVEYGQLQLEASTWAMHARVERIAGQALRMRAPDARRVQIVPLEPAGAGAAQ